MRQYNRRRRSLSSSFLPVSSTVINWDATCSLVFSLSSDHKEKHRQARTGSLLVVAFSFMHVLERERKKSCKKKQKQKKMTGIITPTIKKKKNVAAAAT